MALKITMFFKLGVKMPPFERHLYVE